jgi:hypothetical protein
MIVRWADDADTSRSLRRSGCSVAFAPFASQGRALPARDQKQIVERNSYGGHSGRA